MYLDLPHTLLYIEPTQAPIESDMTGFEWLSILFKLATVQGCLSQNGSFNQGFGCMGSHQCSCGAISTASDYQFPNGMITNSLCMHYLRYHREEIPLSEWEKIKQLYLFSVEYTNAKL